MSTGKRNKTVLTLVAVAMVVLAAASASAGVIVYEGFQYSNVGDILTGQPDGAGTPADIDATGLAGTYAASTTSEQLEIYAGSLTFGDLPVLGNCIGSETTSGNNIYMRNLTAGAQSSVSSAGEIWFSIVVQPNASNSNSTAGFAITNQALTQTKILNNTAVGGLVGFAVGSEGNSNFQPYVWDGTTIATGTTANPALSTTDGTNYLLVGHISFDSGGGGADVYKLYNYELNAGSVVAGTLTQIGDTLEVDLDQSTLDRIQFTRQRRPSYDELRIGTSLNIVLGSTGPTDAFPPDGSLVAAGDVELSWTNLPPNTGSDVYVDVWFGTEPNELHPGYDITRIVTEGQNTTAVMVDASVSGNYYWQVDSYINGADHINEPNMIEGLLWTFSSTSDFPPESVDAGENMITWSGEGVDLDATVVDDGVSDLTYAWSSDPAEGVVFSDETAEDPIVTITKPAWVDVTVPNAGFEYRAVLGDTDKGLDRYNQGTLESWRHFEVDNNGGPLRIWNIGDPANPAHVMTQGICDVGFGGVAPDGDYVVVVRTRYNDDEFHSPPQVRDFEAAVQLLDEKFNPGTSYKLTAKVGRMPEGPDNGGSINYLWTDGGEDPNLAGGIPAWNGYAVQLVVGGTAVDSGGTYARRVEGGTVIAQDWNTVTVPMNTFVTSATVEYTPEYAPDPLLVDLAGLPLQIRLCALEDPADHSTTSWAAFDDVKLQATALTYTLTLGVTDEYNTTPVEDTLEIDVYDNPCHAALFGLSLGAENPLDYNKDCIANLEDAAVMASKWAVDNSLTEAIAK